MRSIIENAVEYATRDDDRWWEHYGTHIYIIIVPAVHHFGIFLGKTLYFIYLINLIEREAAVSE
jgi:hypothetical protein